ncbi:hypothetical protein [Streptomyces sp. BRA346]|uniref:hypothetical protein n=1 Tax=Streptomyces sp. BRA346 TaxID=2878199 RepID=UPI0040635F01
MDEYAYAAQGPPAYDVAELLRDALGWAKESRIRSGATPFQAQIVHDTQGVWLGVTGGATVQLYGGLVEYGAPRPYRDAIRGTESGELSPYDGKALLEAARAVLDRVAQSR